MRANRNKFQKSHPYSFLLVAGIRYVVSSFLELEPRKEARGNLVITTVFGHINNMTHFQELVTLIKHLCTEIIVM